MDVCFDSWCVSFSLHSGQRDTATSWSEARLCVLFSKCACVREEVCMCSRARVCMSERDSARAHHRARARESTRTRKHKRERLYSSVLQCVAVCCSVLQCVAVCCNVLQCVAVRNMIYFTQTREGKYDKWGGHNYRAILSARSLLQKSLTKKGLSFERDQAM